MRVLRPVFLCFLGGCSIIWAPSRDKLDGGPDGGVDVGMDRDVPDAPDGDVGSDADAGFDARGVEVCDNGEDDDGDLLVDCADFDCGGTPDCCEEGVVGMPLIATWVGAALEAFTLLPGGPAPAQDAGDLTNFTPDASQALVGDCTALAQGARIVARFRPQLTSAEPTRFGCDGPGSPCDDFAAIVLTPVVGLNSETGRLPDELGVQVHASGRIELKVAGEVRDSVSVGPSADAIVVEVDLSPTVSPGGFASVRADVAVRVGGLPLMPLDPVYIDQRNLLSDEDGCREIGGLFFAFEGRGVGTRIGAPTRVDSLQCSNPSVFVRPRQDIVPLHPLTADRAPETSSLGWGDTSGAPMERWASGGIGSPALLGMGTGPSVVWHVLGEASDLQPTLEPSFPGVGYAVGHSSSLDSRWNDSVWTGTSAEPRLYSQLPPSCPPGTCTRLPDFRDPQVLPIEGGAFVVVSFAREVGASHQLRGVVLTMAEFEDESLRISDDTSAFVATTGFDACTDLRDPVLVPRPTMDDRYWLFYRCGDGSHIGAIPLYDGPAAEWQQEAAVSLIDASAFGADALGEFEVLVDRIEGDGDASYTYRLWGMALGREGTSLVLAVGDTKTGAASDLPAFVPYPANPVATPELVCAGIVGDCRFTGVGLGRDPDSDARLRFLMAREVPRSGGGSRYEFVPFDQIWRASGAAD